ncbi:MAG: SusC/RagA family TonB-linked outer membrane protein [Bacteroidota bacterium]
MKLKVDYLPKMGLVVLALLLGNALLAQRTITGTITDAENGDPLIGANVLVVGTSTGTVTEFDGTYSLNVPADAKALEFSYTGYGSQTIEITADQTTLDISLAPGQALEEVVVVGYGTQKAKEITSSVVSIKAEDFNQGNVNDPVQLLQGKVAGLSIARPGGDPNGGFQIRLRGLSTFGAQLEPLVVVDGVPGASLQNIDPNDIASIDVLKDGSAAAIYGTRGSSGVILITTKKGTKGGTVKVDYNAQVTVENIANSIDIMNADEYIDIGGTDIGSDTDWYDAVSQTGVFQVHNLSLSGGLSANNSYRFAVNYREGEGILRNSGFDQLNARLNLSQAALDDRLKMTMNLSATRRNSDIGFSEAFRYATYYNPTAPILDASQTEFDGYYQLANFDYFNPVSIIEQNINEGQTERINADFRASFEVIDGLSLSAFYSYQNNDELFGEYYGRFSRFRGSDRGGLARRITNNFTNQLFELTGQYERDFSGLNFRLLGGYSYQDFFNEGSFIEAGEFLTDAFTYNNLNASNDISQGEADVDSYKNSDRLIAFFGRINLNYDDTYFLTASIRREGSSRFGDNNKWGWFPAVSGGVTLTNLFETEAIDNLKLRVGYGVTGNNAPQSYLSFTRFGPSGAFYPVDGSLVGGWGPVSNSNPDLKWEVKSELNVGLDFALLDYKLTGSIDYYTRTTEDLILEVGVDQTTNFFDQNFVNLGELQSSGLELALNAVMIDNQAFSYETGVTFTYFIENEIVSLNNSDFQFAPTGQLPRANLGAPGLNDTRLILLQEGAPVGQIWGPVFNGINDDGTYNLTDVDGNGEINEADNQVIGNGLPDFELGWNNTFTFGDFDFNFFLRGTFGHDLVNTYRVFYENLNAGSIGSFNRVKTDNFDPSLTDAPFFSSYYVEDASFLRLDNATLGYNIQLPEGSWFRKLRVFVNAQNLFTITDYTGVDPEARWVDTGTTDNGGRPLETPDALSPGIERRSTYFTQRAFTFGVNVGF